MRRVVRAPNHLGDAVMSLPALAALAALGPLEVQGPGWLPVLVHGLGISTSAPGTLPRGVDEALLFAPSLGAAWAARRARRRVGTPSDGRRWLLTDPIQPRIHRAGTYAAVAEAVGAQVVGEPRIELPGGAVAPEVPAGHVGLNPVVAGGPSRAWPGFGVLADALIALGLPVVFYAGPGELRALEAIAGGHPIQAGLSLPSFALILQRCAVFVSNDSGAAHFARAVGAEVVVVYGSTSPGCTGAAGAVAVRGPALPCAPCYRPGCPLDRGCLQIEPERVLRAVQGILGAGSELLGVTPRPSRAPPGGGGGVGG